MAATPTEIADNFHKILTALVGGSYIGPIWAAW